jgi:hypothetical protein
MINNKSAALFRAVNIFEMDYPLEAAVISALGVCDEAVIVVGQSQDTTRHFVYQMQEDYGEEKIKVVETYIHFDRGWEERWWNLASAYTAAEWLFWLDADEAIHEYDVPLIKETMRKPEVELIRFPFLHFYASKDYTLRMPLKTNTRMGRRSAGFRIVNWCTDEHPNHSACQAVFGLKGKQENANSWSGPNIVEVMAPIYHYGWCRKPLALAMSRAKHRAWYADGGGLEDGRLPEVKPFDFRIKDRLANGQIAQWQGNHPAVMDSWFKQHEFLWNYGDKKMYI